MTRIDLLILAGAGAMALTAGGLWLSQSDIFKRPEGYVLRPMSPSADMPVFERDPEKAKASREARFTKTDSGEGAGDRIAVRRVFLDKAKRLRASPCNATAKGEYLRAMSAYVGLKLADIRRSGGDRRWETPEDYQIIEYLDRMMQDNFITQAEYRQAMKNSTPALAVTMEAAERQGQVMEMPSYGPSACDAHNQGERAAPMSWEPQPRSANRRESR